MEKNTVDRRHILSLSVITALGLILLPGSAVSQQAGNSVSQQKSLNPQPLPPGSKNSLNPQPLPPKTNAQANTKSAVASPNKPKAQAITPPGSKSSLNPQPLPPR